MRILVKITNQNTRGQMLHPQTLTANLITDIRVNERKRKLSFAAGNASYLYSNKFFANFYKDLLRKL